MFRLQEQIQYIRLKGTELHSVTMVAMVSVVLHTVFQSKGDLVASLKSKNCRVICKLDLREQPE